MLVLLLIKLDKESSGYAFNYIVLRLLPGNLLKTNNFTIQHVVYCCCHSVACPGSHIIMQCTMSMYMYISIFLWATLPFDCK